MHFGSGTVAVLGAIYLPFALRLPQRRRRLIVIAAALVLAESLRSEMLDADLESSVDEAAAQRWAEFGTDSFRYAMSTAVEELFEMFGVVVFIYAPLDGQRRRRVRCLFVFGGESTISRRSPN